MALFRKLWSLPAVVYYRRWFSAAFAGPWGWLGAASTLITFVVPLAVRINAKWGALVNGLSWAIALGVCAGYAAIRLFAASYWIWRDDIAPLNERGRQVIASRNATYVALTEVVRLAQYLSVTPPTDEPTWEAWQQVRLQFAEAFKSLQTVLEPHEWQIISHVLYHENMKYTSKYNDQHNKYWIELQAIIPRLQQLQQVYARRELPASSNATTSASCYCSCAGSSPSSGSQARNSRAKQAFASSADHAVTPM